MAAKTPIPAPKQIAAPSQVMDRAKLFWTGLSQQQRVYLVVGLAITLAVVGFLVKMIASPNYKPLMSGLEGADAQAITAQLTAKKIPYVLGPDGASILVPADKVDEARLEVASHDATHSGRIGFEIFDKVSWGQTEFDEKVNYQRALEGELERTISTMHNVKSARVHLVMATESVFSDRERGAKASVTLKLKRGNLTREQLASISRLVAGAVDELKPSDVSIVDADSDQQLGQAGGSNDLGQGIEQELTRRLITTLAPIVGSDRIRATVNVEYETSSSEESQEKYDPAVSATLSIQRSEEATGPGAAIGGVPGTSSNVPASKAGAPTATAKDPSQSSKTESASYGVNKVTRHVIDPAGGIRRITAAVVLDDVLEHKQDKGKWIEVHHKRSPEELKMIGDVAQAAIGYNSERGDVVSVQNLAFDRAETEDLPPANLLDKARKGISDFASLVRYAVLILSLLIVYFLMIRPIQKRVLTAPLKLPGPMDSPLGFEGEDGAMPEFGNTVTQRSLALKKELSEYVRAEPESSTIAVRAWLREEAE